MYRIIIGVAFLVGLALFVRHQYQKVIGRVTAPGSQSAFPDSRSSQPGRQKCLMCAGTGRITGFNSTGAPAGGSQSRLCPTCNGAGWTQNP